MELIEVNLSTEIGLQRRRARSLKGVSATALKNENILSQLPSRNIDYLGVEDTVDGAYSSRRLSVEANKIAEKLLDDEQLMQNDKDRVEGLRRMPEGLTLKRKVRNQLHSSVKARKSNTNLSGWKKLQYFFTTLVGHAIEWFKNMKYHFELWYIWLKRIEGHFGSGVASYFKFLRWMFLINIVVFIISLGFVVTPQLILEGSRYNESTISPARKRMMDRTFRLGNIFTGEGYLTSSILFYGFYSNETLSFNGFQYNMPSAYFFSALVSYFFVFVSLSISMAVSYKKSFIERADGVNIFANKVFSGWDFGITTREAATLKRKSIYIELKELLHEEQIAGTKKPWLAKAFNFGQQIIFNTLLLAIIVVSEYYAWEYLIIYGERDLPTTMMISLIITLIIHLAPLILKLLLRFEEYDSPRTAVYITLIRMFVINMSLVGLIVAKKLTDPSKDKHKCWETGLGQEIYRLVLLDTLVGLIITTLAQFVRFRIALTVWSGIGFPKFDIARNTMNLIYNLTLLYVGLYFSPLLSLMILIKLLVTFYIKALGAIYNCRPSKRMWRANQAHTVFLIFAFLAFCLVLGLYGYILSSVRTSECGPFRGNKLMYQDVMESVAVDTHSSIVLSILLYVRKPGVVAVLLLAMCLAVYYVRAVGFARKRVLEMLQEILRLQADDKNFLLQCLSDFSKYSISSPGDASFSRRFSNGYKSQPNLSVDSPIKSIRNSQSLSNIASTSNLSTHLNEQSGDSDDKAKKLNFNPIFTPSKNLEELNESESPFHTNAENSTNNNRSQEITRTPYTPFNYDEKIPSRISYRNQKARRRV